MKVETHVHHLFDAIRKDRVLTGNSPDSYAKWRKFFAMVLPLFEKLPIIVVRDPVGDAIPQSAADAARDWNVASRLFLPHPEALIETRVRTVDGAGNPMPDSIWISYAVQREDYMTCIVFMTTRDRMGDWLASPYIPRLDRGDPDIGLGVVHKDDGAALTEMSQVTRTLSDNSRSALVAICGLSQMMAAPATVVRTEHVTVPKEVNRGRSLIKKSRIPNHTILTLPKVAYVAPDGSGTHASPRPHWRRHHERRYPSGKVVQIDRILVNAKPGEPPPPPPVTEVVVRH